MKHAEFTKISQLLEYQSTQNPDIDALLDSTGVTLSWSQFADSVRDMSEFLTSSGVRSKQHVLIVAENCCAAVVFVFAVTRIGATAIPVNARMSSRELLAIQRHCDPVMIVYTSAVSEEALQHANRQNASNADHAVQFADSDDKTIDTEPSFSQAAVLNTVVGEVMISVSESESSLPEERCAHETAVILYTTGTTGEPKGVMLSHSNLLFAGLASATLRSITSIDCVYGALPISHVFGLASVIMASATVGACVHLQARFHPANLLLALQQGITVLPAVPQMHALLMNYTAEQGIDNMQDCDLRYVSSGAAPLDPAWKRKAELFYGLALQNGYGMTESSAGISSTRNEIGSEDVSVGLALAGIEIRIAHEPGSDSPSEGEILTRGAHVMLGYYKDEEQTAQVIDAEGFLHTGDIGYIDEKGRLHVSGRCKELIIRGGFNVFPPEVEAALNHHPEVVQSAVIGRKLDTGDEEIIAFVQCIRGAKLTKESLMEFSRARLTAYKNPNSLFFVDALPAAPTGKILKHRLLSVFSELID